MEVIFLIIIVLCIFTPPGLIIAGCVLAAIVMGGGPIMIVAGIITLLSGESDWGWGLICGGVAWIVVLWPVLFYGIAQCDQPKKHGTP